MYFLWLADMSKTRLVHNVKIHLFFPGGRASKMTDVEENYVSNLLPFPLKSNYYY